MKYEKRIDSYQYSENGEEKLYSKIRKAAMKARNG
jgi:hypothetical protein